MNEKTARFIAMLLLVIPGVAATYGFLLMKDAFFMTFALMGGDIRIGIGQLALRFFGGLILFALGISFIAGWIFFRDRKRNYVAPRFKPKKRPRPRRQAPTSDES